MANVGELDRVRRFLRDHPDLHNQREWLCGTTACVAGWTCALRQGVQPGTDLGALEELNYLGFDGAGAS